MIITNFCENNNNILNGLDYLRITMYSQIGYLESVTSNGIARLS